MHCAVLDLETTDLSAVGGGMILCAVVKPLEGKPIVFRYDEMKCRPFHEKRLVEALVEEMSKYQMWIGHNIDWFDFQFLKSRAVLLGVSFNCSPLAMGYDVALQAVGLIDRAQARR